MSKILLTHPGTQHAPRLAQELFNQDLLNYFCTSLSLKSDYSLFKIFPSLKHKFLSRIIDDIPAEKIISYPYEEIESLIKLKLNYSNIQKIYFKRNKQFQKKISNRLIKESDVIVGFDTSSWILIERAHKLGKKFILDCTTIHSKEKEGIYRNISIKHPEWREDVASKPSDFITLEQKEFETADRIIVASSFAKNSLIKFGVKEEKIVVNPYGVDSSKFSFTPKVISNSKIRFLFIGLASGRKGIPVLLEAWKKIDQSKAELWIVGPIPDKNRELLAKYSNIKICGRIAHNDLPEILNKCDVLVFPSYLDGFGLVILEAMASGLPVITTNATGGVDCIKEGKEGFVIQSGDEYSLVEKMEYFIQNKDQITKMGLDARKKSEKYTWKAYGERWKKIIKEVS